VKANGSQPTIGEVRRVRTARLEEWRWLVNRDMERLAQRITELERTVAAMKEGKA
jgi:hypothetical protein